MTIYIAIKDWQGEGLSPRLFLTEEARNDWMLRQLKAEWKLNGIQEECPDNFKEAYEIFAEHNAEDWIHQDEQDLELTEGMDAITYFKLKPPKGFSSKTALTREQIEEELKSFGEVDGLEFSVYWEEQRAKCKLFHVTELLTELPNPYANTDDK